MSTIGLKYGESTAIDNVITRLEIEIYRDNNSLASKTHCKSLPRSPRCVHLCECVNVCECVCVCLGFNEKE